MKKFLFLAAAFVAGFSAMAQQKADEVMKVSADKHDFGKIKQGVPVTTNFVITNTSDKPVMIENAWAGCGCTTPEYSKEPIPAGGTSILKVGYNAASAGHFDKDVNIKLVGVQDTKIVKITGDVVQMEGDAITKKEPVKAEPTVTATTNTNVSVLTSADKKPATTTTKTKVKTTKKVS